MNYAEYTTIDELRRSYSDIISTKDDVTLLGMLRSTSRDITEEAGRHFVPIIQTRYYNPLKDVNGRTLHLDDDLLSITTLTNGDTNVITSGQYILETPNMTPYWGITLKLTQGVVWQFNADAENSISVLGTWGHDGGGYSGWAQVDTLNIAASADMTISQTTATVQTKNSVKAGQLVKIDSEYMYFGAVTDTAASGVVRAANGSTATTHAWNAAVYVWQIDDQVKQLANQATAIRYKQRQDPSAISMVIEGQTIQIPKDTREWVRDQLLQMGLVRTVSNVF